jgi:hypothetical protein
MVRGEAAERKCMNAQRQHGTTPYPIKIATSQRPNMANVKATQNTQTSKHQNIKTSKHQNSKPSKHPNAKHLSTKHPNSHNTNCQNIEVRH